MQVAYKKVLFALVFDGLFAYLASSRLLGLSREWAHRVLKACRLMYTHTQRHIPKYVYVDCRPERSKFPNIRALRLNIYLLHGFCNRPQKNLGYLDSWRCACIHTNIYIYIYICKGAYIYIYICIHTYIQMHTPVYRRVCVRGSLLQGPLKVTPLIV